MEQRISVKQALVDVQPGTEVLVKGWVRTVRAGKDVTFIALNDGSCMGSLQIVAGPELGAGSSKISTGSAVAARGTLVESPAGGQRVEPVSYTHLDVYKRQAGGWLAANRGRNIIGWCILCAIFPVFLMVIYFNKPVKEVPGKFKRCRSCQEWIKWGDPVCKYCNASQPAADI